MAFFTEKETEYWLESEQREIPLGDGKSTRITHFRHIWATMDELTTDHDVTVEWISELAVENAELLEIPLDTSLANIIHSLDKKFKAAFDGPTKNR